ncbi:LysE family translocator [Halomonas sp. MCCC 1A11036]|uniref:LysE family translocator n=1 Tax=Billgrantia zhangzhouensis TaxID=2733481 RepID=A0ABS9AIP2_9GAMM|nr:LysE family translocator [Halomonas zhangzhouensis]MCE8021547.1 LysE family translocator [Halomonas zhangzhouensis]
MTLDYLLTSLVVVAAPGTGVFYTLATGITHGTRASTIAALGCTLGIVPHMLAAITGLASLLQASETAFQLLKLLGIAYLLYIALSMLNSREETLPTAALAPLPARQLIGTGVLLNLLNPKLTLFFFAFLPQFVDAGTAPLMSMIQLSLAFMLMTFVVFIVYGVGAATARQRILTRPSMLTWLRRGFAAGFLAMAARLALTER